MKQKPYENTHHLMNINTFNYILRPRHNPLQEQSDQNTCALKQRTLAYVSSCMLPQLENCPPLPAHSECKHGEFRKWFQSVRQTMRPGLIYVCWSELLVLVSHFLC